MPVKKIGQAEFAASYNIARVWLSGKISRSEAVTRLAEDFGLNPVSAGDLLQALSAIFRGEGFTRSISAAAAEFYVLRIASDDGVDAARRAIGAIEKHVEYYESVQPSTMHKMRGTLAKLNRLTDKVERTSKQIEFEGEVAKFAAMSEDERRKHLPPKGAKPKVTISQVKTYVRSAAVVAEVRLRAAGKCESCLTPAPFTRASNGEPFLEVHHIVQLADDGDDTVENAVAVCPNCHRKFHFG